MSDQDTRASVNETWRSLAGMYAVVCSGSEKKYKMFENILKRNNCLNERIPALPYFKRKKPELIGNTLLHVAVSNRENGSFNFLMAQGAKYTLKNAEGETVAHQAFRKSFNNSKECDKLWGVLKHPFIDAVMCRHLQDGNASNPSNKYGLSHFHLACLINCVKAVEFFLKNGVSVNGQVNFDSPTLAGYSPLHFAARYCGYEVALVLLQHGANLNLKDAKGMSPLHLLIDRNTEIADWLNTGRRTRHEAFQKELHINERILASFLEHSAAVGANVVDDKGFTYLHIACTLHDTAVVEKLLEAGYKVDSAISDDSPISPGYTPIHFAAHFSIETVKLLLSHGADISRKDAKGRMPFDVCLTKLDVARDIHELIASQPSWKNISFSDGKTSLFDFVFALQQRESLNKFLQGLGLNINMRLEPNSPLWPGYTPLHLLVLFVVSSNGAWDLYESSDYTDDVSWHDLRMIDAIDLCLKLGGDVASQDSRGYSPLHLAFHLQKAYLVSFLLRSHTNIVNPVDENGLSHFHIACVAKDTDFVEKLLKTQREPDLNRPIPFTFRLSKEKKTFTFVKGSTPLHVAVITRNNELVKILLTHGANYVLKDGDSLTPVHRLFGLNRGDDRDLAQALLSSYNLCFINDVAPASSCGLTYLHVITYWDKAGAVERLLNLGADINAVITYKRVDHRDSGKSRCRSILSEHPIDSLTFLANYTGYTPLQLAMAEKNYKTVKVLVECGADILARNPKGISPIYNVLKAKYGTLDTLNYFVKALRSSCTLQNRMREDSGLTMLHVACAATDIDLVRHLCEQGLNVNARTHDNSPIWPGCTPLHVLMIKSKDNIDYIAKIIKLLFEYGADITITNADQKTPLHEDFERYFVQGPRFANLLLQAQTDYSINPVSIKGVSHFHIACSCKEVTAVEGFLKHGVDINLPINYFCEFYGGLTPLHLASVHHLKDVFIFVGKRRIDVEHAIHYILQIRENPFYVASNDDYEKTVDLLLQHGANPNTEDRSGNTSVHVAVASKIPHLDIWESLLRAGANLNVENLLDETPLEILLPSEKLTSTFIEFFLRHGGKVNVYDPDDQEGFIPRICQRYYQEKEVIQRCLFEAMLNVSDISYFDEMGRSLIHNVVSHNKDLFHVRDYVKFCEDFAKLGHDVDHADKNGRTALHVAIEFQNVQAIIGLLDSGADINVLRPGDKAFIIMNEELQKKLMTMVGTVSILNDISMHINKLKLCKIYVNSFIQELDEGIREDYSINFEPHEQLCSLDITKSKNVKIEPHSITLYDFLSDAKVVSSYPRLPQIQRRAINDFFKNNSQELQKNLPQLFGVIKLQYRKALARIDLMEPAKAALSTLMELDFPDLCSEAVIRFLSNEDLKNLTESANTDM